MEKRDQINIVLDSVTRDTLNELRRRDPRLPTVSTIIRELIMTAAGKCALDIDDRLSSPVNDRAAGRGEMCHG